MARHSAAEFRLTAPNGTADLTWLSGVIIPPGWSVECLDLGWRNDIVVSVSSQSAAVVIDTRSGERALLAEEGTVLADFVLALAKQRLRVSSSRRRQIGTERTELQLIAESTGAKWLAPDDDN